MLPRLAKSITPPESTKPPAPDAVATHTVVEQNNPITAPAVAATLLVLDHSIVSAIGTVSYTHLTLPTNREV